MTVAELIKKLQSFDQSLEVVVSVNVPDCEIEIDTVEVKTSYYEHRIDKIVEITV
jgi:hypothetical protein